MLYSLVGFILPLTCRLKDKWLLVLACVLLIQPLPLYYAIRAACDPAFVTPAVPTGICGHKLSPYNRAARFGKPYA